MNKILIKNPDDNLKNYLNEFYKEYIIFDKVNNISLTANNELIEYLKLNNVKFYYIADKCFNTKEITDPVLINSSKAEAKIQRDTLLQETDWTDTLSAKDRLGDKYYVWQNYRQQLRDITLQENYPLEINWPEKPYVENSES
jgi:hypothetical protein